MESEQIQSVLFNIFLIGIVLLLYNIMMVIKGEFYTSIGIIGTLIAILSIAAKSVVEIVL